MNNSVFIVHRKNRNYFIDRVEKEFFLGHLIYKKIVKGKKNKQKEERTKGHIMSIRKRLMNFYQDEKEEGEGKIIPDNLEKTKSINKKKSEKKEKYSSKASKTNWYSDYSIYFI